MFSAFALQEAAAGTGAANALAKPRANRPTGRSPCSAVLLFRYNAAAHKTCERAALEALRGADGRDLQAERPMLCR